MGLSGRRFLSSRVSPSRAPVIIIIINIFFFQATNLKAAVKQKVGSAQDSGTKVRAFLSMDI